MQILNLRHTRTYVNLAIERSIFYGQGTVEINTNTMGNHLNSASPHEVTLLEKTPNNIAVSRETRGRPKRNPQRVIADKGYDSDPLRKRLADKGIELICPSRQYKKQRGIMINANSDATKDVGKLKKHSCGWEIFAALLPDGIVILLSMMHSFILLALS